MADGAFDDLDMAAARAKFAAKADGRRVARKSRQKKTADAVDGRSLKATPQIKQALAKHVPKGKTSLWLEEAIVEKLKREGIDIDA